jgi:hypothetical protein
MVGTHRSFMVLACVGLLVISLAGFATAGGNGEPSAPAELCRQ